MSIAENDGDSALAGKEAARPALDVLLTEANRLRARGRISDAIVKCREALSKDGDFWQAYELMGDILRQQGRVTAAIEAYQAAKALNPRRVAVEDKIARSCALLAYQQYALANPAHLVGEQPPRKPVLAAFLSLLFPGLGQLYNRHYVKGVVVLGAALMVLMFLVVVALTPIVGRQGVYSATRIASAFVSGQALYLSFVVAGVWIYAIADAAIQAAKPDESAGGFPLPAADRR